jgi:hypothetical protein
MNDRVILYVFAFLLISNLLLSVIYAFGMARIKLAMRKFFREISSKS